MLAKKESNLQQDIRFLTKRRCANCLQADKCPFFDDAEDAICAIDEKKAISIRDSEQLTDYTQTLLEISAENLLNLISETKNAGAGYNPEITKNIETQINILEKLKIIMSKPQDEISIKAVGPNAGSMFYKYFGNSGGD